MKIRNGFVSNSSSSSFICQVCGEEASGMDMGLEDAGMYECENGHTFCESHMLEFDEKEITKAILLEQIEKYENQKDKKTYELNYLAGYKKNLEQFETLDEDKIHDLLYDSFEFRYNAHNSCCPICQFDVIIDSDLSQYLLKKLGTTAGAIKTEIRNDNATYKEFRQKLRNK